MKRSLVFCLLFDLHFRHLNDRLHARARLRVVLQLEALERGDKRLISLGQGVSRLFGALHETTVRTNTHHDDAQHVLAAANQREVR